MVVLVVSLQLHLCCFLIVICLCIWVCLEIGCRPPTRHFHGEKDDKLVDGMKIYTLFSIKP